MNSMIVAGSYTTLALADIAHAALDAKRFNICSPKAAAAYVAGSVVAGHVFFSTTANSLSLLPRVILTAATSHLSGRSIAKILYNENITFENAGALLSAGFLTRLALVPICVAVGAAIPDQNMSSDLKFAAATALCIMSVGTVKLLNKAPIPSQSASEEKSGNVLVDPSEKVLVETQLVPDQSTFESPTPLPQLK